MDPDFWHERWQKKETGFHQPAVNDLLQLYWPRLGLEAGSEVFVPLCGRSLDMVSACRSRASRHRRGAEPDRNR